MPRWLLVGDIHLSDKPPSSCTESYLDDLLDLLEQTVQLELDKECSGVVWAGDVFHHRRPDRTSHKTMQRAVELVQRYRNLWIVPGNHDMAPGDRFDSIYQTQPLGVLLRAGARLLSGWAEGGQWQDPTGTFNPVPIYGVPWLQMWSDGTVQDALEGWYGDSPEHLRDALVVAHAPLYPPGLEPPYESFSTVRWAELMGYGWCYYGHVHEAHGIYEVLTPDGEQVVFCNQGAITRGSLAEHDVNRQVAVTTWSPEEGFVRVDLAHRPPEEVYLTTTAPDGSTQLAGHVAKAAAADLEQFLAGVGSAQVEVTSVEALIQSLATLTEPGPDGTEVPLEAAVRELATELLRDASA